MTGHAEGRERRAVVVQIPDEWQRGLQRRETRQLTKRNIVERDQRTRNLFSPTQRDQRLVLSAEAPVTVHRLFSACSYQYSGCRRHRRKGAIEYYKKTHRRHQCNPANHLPPHPMSRGRSHRWTRGQTFSLPTFSYGGRERRRPSGSLSWEEGHLYPALDHGNIHQRQLQRNNSSRQLQPKSVAASLWNKTTHYLRFVWSRWPLRAELWRQIGR